MKIIFIKNNFNNSNINKINNNRIYKINKLMIKVIRIRLIKNWNNRKQLMNRFKMKFLKRLKYDIKILFN